MKKIKISAVICSLAILLPLSIGNTVNFQEKLSVVAEEESTLIDSIEKISVETNATNPLKLSAKSAFVFEPTTETIVYSYNETDRLPIASMCKIMTLLLCFNEIENGNLDFNEEILISEKASSMGGSQVFLEQNAKYPVKELIKSIAVCSANDSCVAMAERISGSEDVFVDVMNQKAKELGANNTLFSNCTGLPKEPQYSCAKDVAIMLKALIKHKEYYDFGQIWMDKFQHPKGRITEISNTNKLVKFYDGCDGGKTGFTNQAGFCLAATAQRNDVRVISVVIGEKDSKTRFKDVRATFDYAFANYLSKTVIDCNNPLEEKVKVSAGKKQEISVRPLRDSKIFSKRGENDGYTTQILYKNNLKAPLKYGEIIGEIIVFRKGVEVDRVPLIANENVEKANIFDRFKEIVNGWFIS